jgi:hypothetical protein
LTLGGPFFGSIPIRSFTADRMRCLQQSHAERRENSGCSERLISLGRDPAGARRFLGRTAVSCRSACLPSVSGPPRPPNDDAIARSSVRMRRNPGASRGHMYEMETVKLDGVFRAGFLDRILKCPPMTGVPKCPPRRCLVPPKTLRVRSISGYVGHHAGIDWTAHSPKVEYRAGGERDRTGVSLSGLGVFQGGRVAFFLDTYVT